MSSKSIEKTYVTHELYKELKGILLNDIKSYTSFVGFLKGGEKFLVDDLDSGSEFRGAISHILSVFQVSLNKRYPQLGDFPTIKCKLGIPFALRETSSDVIKTHSLDIDVNTLDMQKTPIQTNSLAVSTRLTLNLDLVKGSEDFNNDYHLIANPLSEDSTSLRITEKYLTLETGWVFVLTQVLLKCLAHWVAMVNVTYLNKSVVEFRSSTLGGGNRRPDLYFKLGAFRTPLFAVSEERLVLGFNTSAYLDKVQDTPILNPTKALLTWIMNSCTTVSDVLHRFVDGDWMELSDYLATQLPSKSSSQYRDSFIYEFDADTSKGVLYGIQHQKVSNDSVAVTYQPKLMFSVKNREQIHLSKEKCEELTFTKIYDL